MTFRESSATSDDINICEQCGIAIDGLAHFIISRKVIECIYCGNQQELKEESNKC